MVIAAAAEAFIDLVEPNWVISRTTSLAFIASSLSPGPSWSKNHKLQITSPAQVLPIRCLGKWLAIVNF